MEPRLREEQIAVDGVIQAVGKRADCDVDGAERVVDAKGTTLAPGSIDSHVHPVFGDWTPRQSQLNWIDSYLNGGVTTMVSAGEVHLPGRPKDVVGLKALAVTAQRTFSNLRPAGVKVLAGAPVLEHGMEEQDFKDLAEAGVSLLGEVGLGGVKQGEEAKKMVAWARKYAHPVHDPHRRTVDPRVRADRRRRGAGGRRRGIGVSHAFVRYASGR